MSGPIVSKYRSYDFESTMMNAYSEPAGYPSVPGAQASLSYTVCY